MRKYKVTVLIILILVLVVNFYFSIKNPDIYTNSKINLSSIRGSTSYLGRLSFWKLLVQNNDWENASTLESKINPIQVQKYKLSYQPEQLKSQLSQLNDQEIKTADDYLQLAKIQSILGQPSQAIDSIKRAHQLDPVRSDVDRLFYQIN